MAKEIAKTTISFGDKIVVRSKVYRCKRRTGSDCTQECSLFDQKTGRCSGTCFRYHKEDIVFKFCKWEDELKPNEVVFRTPYIERYDEALKVMRLIQKI